MFHVLLSGFRIRHTEWINAQRVSAPTPTILPTTAGIFPMALTALVMWYTCCKLARCAMCPHSSDILKECEFNTRWRQWITFRGEINWKWVITDILLNMARGTKQSTPVSEIKGYVRHSNHLKKAGAYNGRNVGINMATKMRTIVRKM